MNRGVPLAAVAIGRARQALQGAAPVAPDPDAELRQWREEAREEAREQGWREGHAQGLRAGHAEGLAQGQAAAAVALAEALAKASAPLRQQERDWATLLASVQQQARRMAEAVEAEAVALCFETICRVLGSALLTPAAVQAQVRALMAVWQQRGLVAVHLHPQDAARLPLPAGPCTWVADPSVALGGCILRGSGDALDARLETIFYEVKAALLAARAEAPPVKGEA